MSNRSKRRHEIAALLALREREGLTYKELSTRCGLAASTLAQWAWRLRNEPTPRFADLVVVDDPLVDSSAGVAASKADVLTIRIADCVIEVPPGTDESTLSLALKVARAPC